MSENCSRKILIGAKSIKAYLGDISEQTFKKFINMGLPARVIDNRWYAHTDNIDFYFKKLTLLGDGSMPDDAD